MRALRLIKLGFGARMMRIPSAEPTVGSSVSDLKVWKVGDSSKMFPQVALESLAFQNVGASIRACEAIAELVTAAGSLRTLALYNNMSDDAGASAIAGLLGRAPLMESFRMASSRVGAAGGIALAQGLSAGYSTFLWPRPGQNCCELHRLPHALLRRPRQCASFAPQNYFHIGASRHAACHRPAGTTHLTLQCDKVSDGLQARR